MLYRQIYLTFTAMSEQILITDEMFLFKIKRLIGEKWMEQ